MQANPALPWAAGGGGHITFGEPITEQDLLDGEVTISLEREGEPQTSVRFVRQTGADNLTVMQGGVIVFSAALSNNVLELVYVESGNHYAMVDCVRN